MNFNNVYVVLTILLAFRCSCYYCSSTFWFSKKLPFFKWSNIEQWWFLEKSNRFTRSTTHGEDCMANCMAGFQGNLASNIPNINTLQAAQENPSYFFTNMDPLVFEHLCQSFITLVQCTDKCIEQEVKDWIKKAFVSVEYMCIEKYSEFKKDLPCIVDAYKTSVIGKCIPFCHKYQLDLDNSRRYTEDYQGLEPNELKNVLNKNCLYLECFVDCERPLVQELCGKRAMHLVQGSIAKALMVTIEVLARHTFGVVLKIEDNNSVQHSNGNDYLPTACQRLTNIAQSPIPYSQTPHSEPSTEHDKDNGSNCILPFCFVILLCILPILMRIAAV